MKKTASLAGFTLLFFAAVSAHALTVTPLPGVANQSAPQSVFFAVPAAVQVTDSAGQPVAGASVQFSAVPFDTTHGAIFFPGPDFGTVNDAFATTDANGVAASGLGAFGYIAGPSGIVATATVQGPLGPQSESVTIPLTVVPGGVASFKAVSGSHQKAAVGTSYGKPWVAQGLDAQGKPVPNAAVIFFADDTAGIPSVDFDGNHTIWVRADANGIATSPVPVANLVEGKGEGFAATLNYQVSVGSAFFDFTNGKAATGGGSGDGCGAQGKGNGNCGNGHGANHGK